MAVTQVHSYLVHPRTAAGAAGGIGGTHIPLVGDLFDLLNEIYEKSDEQCNIDISFNPSHDGLQENPVRDALLAYVVQPTLGHGREIAALLQAATDGRSGMGLLFLIKGGEGAGQKVVLSRFPADNGILAEMDPAGLNVAFLERVFMKNAHAYKAATYSGPPVPGAYWQGRAVDRQIGSSVVRLSEYWIRGFLNSDFRVTPAAGTRRLALALKEANRSVAGVDAKQAITAAATLAHGLDGHQTSAEGFLEHFQLPPEAQTAVRAALKTPAAANEQFVFTAEEFGRHIAYRSVQLDSGAILSAESGSFDEVFERQPTDVAGRMKFSTTGTIVSERLRGKVAV